MKAEEFLNNGFGSNVELINRNHVIELMENFAKQYHSEQCSEREKEKEKILEDFRDSINFFIDHKDNVFCTKFCGYVNKLLNVNCRVF